MGTRCFKSFKICCDADANDLLDRPIIEFALPTRTINALHLAGICSVRDLLDWSEQNLRTLRSIGPGAIAALGSILEAAGQRFSIGPERDCSSASSRLYRGITNPMLAARFREIGCVESKVR